MWLILQQEKPEDYVIATGETTAVKEFVRMTFAELGVYLKFIGEGVDEKGIIEDIDHKRLLELEITETKLQIGMELVAVDPRYFRPTEVDLLIGDASKAKTKLGWEPKYNLAALVKDMILSDLDVMKKEKFLKQAGFRTMNYFE